jgi:hypothetical protein
MQWVPDQHTQRFNTDSTLNHVDRKWCNKPLNQADSAALTFTNTLRVATPLMSDPDMPLSNTAMQYVPFRDSWNM